MSGLPVRVVGSGSAEIASRGLPIETGSQSIKPSLWVVRARSLVGLLGRV